MVSESPDPLTQNVLPWLECVGHGIFSSAVSFFFFQDQRLGESDTCRTPPK